MTAKRTPHDTEIVGVVLSGGREAVIYPLTFGRARLVVGEIGSPFYDDAW